MRIGLSDVDWAGSFYDRQSIYGFCIFAGGSLITWHSKKQNIVAHSSVKAKYQALAPTASEMLWIQSLIHKLGVDVPTSTQMYCDNQAFSIFIDSNPVFHEHTKQSTLIVTLFRIY